MKKMAVKLLALVSWCVVTPAVCYGAVPDASSMPASSVASALHAAQARVATDPTNSAGWAELGNAYAAIKDDEKAIRAYAESLRLAPSDGAALEALGAAYARNGQADHAREMWLKLSAVDKPRAERFFSSYLLPTPLHSPESGRTMEEAASPSDGSLPPTPSGPPRPPFPSRQDASPVTIGAKANPGADADVLVVPVGRTNAEYIVNKEASIFLGGLLGYGLDRAVNKSEEERETQRLDKVLERIGAQQILAEKLVLTLNACGLKAAIHPSVLAPSEKQWLDNPTPLSKRIPDLAQTYRFIIEVGIERIMMNKMFSDERLNGSALARVYQANDLLNEVKDSTGLLSSVRLAAPGDEGQLVRLLSFEDGAKNVLGYLAGAIGKELCSDAAKLKP